MKKIYKNYDISNYSDDDWDDIDEEAEGTPDKEEPKLKTKADKKRGRFKKNDE